jgi:hypothetical protein
MKKLSIVFRQAAILLALFAAVQDGMGQECPKPSFCSRKASATVSKTGYAAYTDLFDGWNGVYSYYLQQDVAVGETIDFSGVGPGSIHTASGSLSAHITFIVDPLNSTPGYLVGSWTNSSSVSENGTYASVNGPVPFSITGAIGGLYGVPDTIGELGGWVWSYVGWQTTNTLNGSPSIHYGVFGPDLYHHNSDLDDFAFCFSDGTQTFTLSDKVKNNDWVYDYSNGSNYGHDSYSETMTLSVPYTDKLLADVINAKIQSFTDDWTDPPNSLTASFMMTTNTDVNSSEYGVVTATGSKMQYRVVLNATEKGTTYRFHWFETVRDRSGKLISKIRKAVTMIGTGNPGGLTMTEIITVQVPRQEGTVVEEDLTVETSSAPTPPHSGTHSAPPPPVPPPGAGGR